MARAHGATALQSELARQILNHIEREQLGTGAPVRELALARTFGVSRTPVRAALGVLAKLGYVRLSPGRGFLLARKLNGARSAAGQGRTNREVGAMCNKPFEQDMHHGIRVGVTVDAGLDAADIGVERDGERASGCEQPQHVFHRCGEVPGMVKNTP